MKILILANDSKEIYNFKNELILELVNPNSYIDDNKIGKNEVVICVPNDIENKRFQKIGCHVVNIEVDRRGTNIINDIKLFNSYLKIIKKFKPDVTLTFTIKPNIYGGLACRITKSKYVSGVMGLGSSIRNKKILSKFVGKLYKIGTKKASYINFENQSDLNYFNNHIYKNNRNNLLPGSGVNLEKFKYKKYPENNNVIKFLTIGRFMKDKGSYELLEAAKIIMIKYDNIIFDFVGLFEEEDLKEKFINYQRKGIINYLGYSDDISTIIENSHCIIHPSYHEGLSNALIEAAASGRPVIASDVPGCRETYENNITGLAIKPKNVDSLVMAIEEFIKKDYAEKKLMGIKARKYIEDRYDRKNVVKMHIEQINNVKLSDYKV